MEVYSISLSDDLRICFWEFRRFHIDKCVSSDYIYIYTCDYAIAVVICTHFCVNRIRIDQLTIFFFQF